MIVWVTGASRGIGRAIAVRFAQDKATVAASGRSADLLDALRREADHGGWDIRTFVCDVTDETSVHACHQRISDAFGAVDVLVNNAGVSVFKSFMDSTTAEFDRLVAANVRGPFLCTKAVLPSMIDRRSGTIVMVNSMAAKDVFRDSSVYAATKAGLKMMTDCLRMEVRKHRVRVLTVFPGATDTEIWPIGAREKFRHRMMSPDDVAEALWQALQINPRAMVEDITLQPIEGAL